MAQLFIVDNGLDAAKYTQIFLEKMGHSITVFDDALDVIEPLQAAPPDILILTGLGLGRYSAEELCRIVKGSPATAHIPVIVISATTDKFHKQQLLEAGAEKCLKKPL